MEPGLKLILRHFFFFFFDLAPFFYLGQGLPDYPSDLYKINVFLLTQHIGPLRDFILKIFLGNWGGQRSLSSVTSSCCAWGLPSRAEVSLRDLSWGFSHLKPAFTLVVAAI